MAPKVLSALFWCFALYLITNGWSSGGWGLVVPGAVALAGVAFGADLLLHRRLVALDGHLVRTTLHLLSAVAVAAACMLWLVRVLLSKAP